MSLNQQDIIKQAIRRYQQEKLFVYYDQLEKKEEFLKTLQMHKLVIINSIGNMIATDRTKYWIERNAHSVLTSLESENFTKTKQHIETFFNKDFFEIFTEVPLSTISIFTTLISQLEIPKQENNTILPLSINNYLEQFIPKKSAASSENSIDERDI